jgi:hypothetical protein
MESNAKYHQKKEASACIATFGGFMDAAERRWRLGPYCDFTLLGRGRNPRYTIGSVNAAGCSSFASGVTFILLEESKG